MIKTGTLHEFDGEWICKMQQENQLAAAIKCSATPLTMWKDIHPNRIKKFQSAPQFREHS